MGSCLRMLLRRLRIMLSHKLLELRHASIARVLHVQKVRELVLDPPVLLSSLTSKNCLTSKTICLPLICFLGIARLSFSDLAKMACIILVAGLHLLVQILSAPRATLRPARVLFSSS